jgi:molybdopterin/thiamine biosynthesis adenylyltransferase
MAWTSELQELANRNKFIENLIKLGYDIGFINSHLVLFGVPYLSEKGELKHFDIISTLDLREGSLIDRPSDHKVWINGELPYNVDGNRVSVNSGPEVHVVTEKIVGQKFLSSKPPRGYYESIEEKIFQYLDLIVPPAKHKFPEATPLQALEARKRESPSPLKFPDALSARDGVVELSHKFLGLKVAIVGCGGTGAYILDFLAKTHVSEIHLHDDDIVHVHTLFRLPGVYGDKDLGEKKVEVLAQKYAGFHGGITPHRQRISSENVSDLSQLNFVFVAVDDGPSRQMICATCHGFRVPFVDVGMGLTKGSAGLFGFVRTSGGEADDFTRLTGTVYLPSINPPDNEYRRQPQIAELNALNAAMAIIRFKQRFGYFDRLTDSIAQVFDVAGLAIDQMQQTGDVSAH